MLYGESGWARPLYFRRFLPKSRSGSVLCLGAILSSSVTPQFLLEGAANSLEQCGLLLRDADLLYRSSSYANGVVLAAYAREALGQWKILLDLRRKVLGGESIAIGKLKTLYDDHVLKQTAGMLSINMSSDRDTGVGKLIMSRIMSVPGSDEWKKTDDALQQLDKIKAKRVPQDRHNLRKLAMYVDPVEDRWNRHQRKFREQMHGSSFSKREMIMQYSV